MAAIGIAPEPVTIEIFLAWEAQVEERHELLDGRIVAMAGAGGNHIAISAMLAGICVTSLEGKACGFFGESGKVVVPAKNSAFYPDGGIACPFTFSNQSAGVIADPVVIFEILSPSTANYDRTGKFDAYKTLPSLQDYVLITADELRVEVYSRHINERWLHSVFLPGTVAHIPSVALDLPLDRLYSRAIFEPTTHPGAIES